MLNQPSQPNNPQRRPRDIVAGLAQKTQQVLRRPKEIVSGLLNTKMSTVNQQLDQVPVLGQVRQFNQKYINPPQPQQDKVFNMATNFGPASMGKIAPKAMNRIGELLPEEKILPGIKSTLKNLGGLVSKASKEQADELMELSNRLRRKNWSAEDLEYAENLVRNNTPQRLTKGFTIERLGQAKDNTVEKLKEFYGKTRRGFGTGAGRGKK